MNFPKKIANILTVRLTNSSSDVASDWNSNCRLAAASAGSAANGSGRSLGENAVVSYSSNIPIIITFQREGLCQRQSKSHRSCCQGTSQSNMRRDMAGCSFEPQLMSRAEVQMLSLWISKGINSNFLQTVWSFSLFLQLQSHDAVA